MRLFAPYTFTALVLAACASAGTTTTPRAPTTPAPPVVVARAPITEPPADWHLLDANTDGVPGISAHRAYRELLTGRTPQRTVVVAVIDIGVDTAHPDLRPVLWRNPREVAGNRTDDDRNGYVDDIHGWNFIGGPDGRNIDDETYEVTRLYRRCTSGPGGGPSPTLPATERERCGSISADFQRERAEMAQNARILSMLAETMKTALPLLKSETGTDSLTVAKVRALRPTSAVVREAQSLYLQISEAGIDPAEVEEQSEVVRKLLEFGLNPSFDPRPIVGDDPADLSQRIYGNRDVTGPDALHGTHVAGIIGAVRDNGLGIDGIAPAVRIMAVRAVPNGDERDKDVANAIRYAVDNGAHIINLSFGKGYSPEKSAVDDAVRHAEARGVLIVHAAGNDGEDATANPSFPTPAYTAGGRARNWIEVGASSWRSGERLAAPFSNYGREIVDVFAPGVDILSTDVGGGTVRESGTSMAAPVVTGVAALLMAYYPGLSATDVKRIIVESVEPYRDVMVVRPGDDSEKVAFGSLSMTGGIVNVYNALRMAATVRPTTR